jgi:uncharacterized protein YqeY
MIKDRLQADLKEAVKGRETVRASTIRLILAALKDREIAARTTDSVEPIGEEEVMSLLARMVRQREESATAYEEGGRLDLADEERREIAVIRAYLPRPMTDAEVESAIACAIESVGATSIRDMGRIMAHLKSKHTGRMDFAKAGAVVKTALR